MRTNVLAQWWGRWGAICGISVLGYLVATRVVWHAVLEPSFAHLETQEASRAMDRAIAVIQRELDNVADTATDYANWDDCHDFVTGGNPEFIRKNFDWAHLDRTMNIQAYAILDIHGHVLTSDSSSYLAKDQGAQCLEVLPVARLRELAPAGPAPHPPAASGIVDTPSGHFLIAAAPIRRSSGDGDGDAAGHVVLARVLDARLLAKIEKRAQIPIQLHDCRAAHTPDSKPLPGDGPLLRVIDANTLRAETAIPGLSGEPALHLVTTLPRPVMARGHHAMRIIECLTAVAIALIAFLFGRQEQRARQLELRTNQLVDSWHKLDDENRQRMQELARRIEAESDLVRLREQLHAVLKAIPLPLFAKDTNGRYILFNPAFEAFFGVRGEDLIGRTVEECWPSEHAKTYHQHDLKLLRDGGLQIYEHRLQNAAGRDRDVIFNKACFANTEGKVAGLVGTLTDVTDVKEAESNRRALERQVQEAHKMESLGLLAGGIAHDFNNLLIGILGRADLALLNMGPDDPAREDLHAIITASHRAADLCRQMLAYSGRGRFVVGHFDVNATIREIVDLLRVSVSKKLDFELDLSPDAPRIAADATQVRQVIMNLVTNAAEAIGDNPGSIRIRTWLGQGPGSAQALPPDTPRATARFAHIEISDTGCGMAPETIGRIFDPFFTTKFTGRGLGLAAALGVIRGHGGSISVNSQPGRGSTFLLALPAVDAPPDTAPAPTAPPEADDKTWKGAGTLLLVDDEEGVRTVAARMCEHLGFSVLVAQDGAEAVRLLKESDGHVTCILLDLIMPGMDGLETLTSLRAINPDVPVVLSSGYSEGEVRRRFGKIDCRAFIEKPYQIPQLRDTLRNALEIAAGELPPEDRNRG